MEMLPHRYLPGTLDGSVLEQLLLDSQYQCCSTGISLATLCIPQVPPILLKVFLAIKQSRANCGQQRKSRKACGTDTAMPHAISGFQAAYITIEVLIALVSIPGNILVIWAVKVNQALRDATFYFIVSLAVADVAVGALVIPLAIIINIGPRIHFYSCLMVACPVLILTESSVLALLAIAVDRYLRVKIPTRTGQYHTEVIHWKSRKEALLMFLSFMESPNADIAD
ncbi:Adenosine receptor A1 [Varanus komodoensis]|nr:Adenosine receptor A1 [Varanus komodoensis]